MMNSGFEGLTAKSNSGRELRAVVGGDVQLPIGRVAPEPVHMRQLRGQRVLVGGVDDLDEHQHGRQKRS